MACSLRHPLGPNALGNQKPKSFERINPEVVRVVFNEFRLQRLVLDSKVKIDCRRRRALWQKEYGAQPSGRALRVTHC